MIAFFFFFFLGELSNRPLIYESFRLVCGKKLLSDMYCDIGDYLHTRVDKEDMLARLLETGSPLAALYQAPYPSANTAYEKWNAFEQAHPLAGPDAIADGKSVPVSPLEARAIVNWIYRAYPKLEDRLEVTRKALGELSELYRLGELALAGSVIYVKAKVEIHSITSFSDFSKTIQGIGSPKHSFYYRGHADSGYLLLPSVMRQSGWAEHEREMYNEILIECPQEFAHCATHLDRLVHMQHYGLPTRLLDITRNPLVALYFACEDKPEAQGEVIVFDVERTQVKYPNSDTVTVLASLPQFSKKDQDEFRSWAESSMSQADFNRKAARLLHEVKLEKPAFRNEIVKEELRSCYVVLSEKRNSRIVKQDGAFIICGLFREHKNPIHQYRYQERKKIQVFLISAKAKSGILSMLNRFSINKAALFPEISDVADYIKRQY